MWTRDRQAALAVLVADCVPVLVATRDGKAVASVHAGWRGTQARIVTRVSSGSRRQVWPPERALRGARPRHRSLLFRAGATKVIAELRQAFPASPAIRAAPSGRTVADLWELNQQALVEAGVPADHIESLRRCTACDSQMFFSHRRDEVTAAARPESLRSAGVGRTAGFLTSRPREARLARCTSQLGS